MQAPEESPAATALPRVENLGLCEYLPVWRRMQVFTRERDECTQDRLWMLQHAPVFTMGMNAKPEHLISPGDIPVLNVDRGGQVTYHGPGQLVVYVLLDIRRLGIGVRGLVNALETSVIELLANSGITAQARRDAPGVYVDGAKIAALGLRIKRGCSYHGLAINVDMDLEPFARINPCGYKGLDVTQLKDLGVGVNPEQLAAQWLPIFIDRLAHLTVKAWN